MARKITTIVQTPKVREFVPVEVPADVVEELSTLYKHLLEHTDERGLAEFDTVEEKAEFVKQAKSWALAEELRFRVIKGSNDTSLTFILAPPLTPEEIAANKAENDKRKAAKAAKAAEK